jgi:2-oxo-hept-3-ene-1,7-dioate hydratase/2-keto-4-pentenoate hydratase|tara:strand:- start:1952 stop:2092 length:141 start_codon:yes stop_codon:yes gene_type:complete
LSEFDLALEAGMVVMTGSFTKQYRFENSIEIEARFDPFGSVTAKLT